MTAGEAAAIRGLTVAETDFAAGTGAARACDRPTLMCETAEASDAELACRVQAGEAAAFDLLVGRHMQRAFGVAYRLLGQREDAEDLVQEAFIAALQKIDTFDGRREFAPWFYRILVNRCLN